MRVNGSIYSRFRTWQEGEDGSAIYLSEKEKVADLIQSIRPSLVVQVEGRALLDSVPEEFMYYHVSEDPNIMTRGFTVEAEQGFLPFPDRSVNLLLLAHSIELYHHPHTVLAECERVLANDGIIFMMVLTSSWLEGSVPSELHPLGDLKIMSVSARKIKEWVAQADLTISEEYNLGSDQSFRLLDMIICPMGYEIRRLEVGWNGMVGAVE